MKRWGVLITFNSDFNYTRAQLESIVAEMDKHKVQYHNVEITEVAQ